VLIIEGIDPDEHYPWIRSSMSVKLVIKPEIDVERGIYKSSGWFMGFLVIFQLFLMIIKQRCLVKEQPLF